MLISLGSAGIIYPERDFHHEVNPKKGGKLPINKILDL